MAQYILKRKVTTAELQTTAEPGDYAIVDLRGKRRAIFYVGLSEKFGNHPQFRTYQYTDKVYREDLQKDHRDGKPVFTSDDRFKWAFFDDAIDVGLSVDQFVFPGMK